MASDQFINKLGSIPVVSSAWTNACDLYQKTKDSHGLIRATCNMAEGGVQTVVSKTMPLVEKYQPQIDQVNAYACEKLAVLEETYPSINKPTDELLKEGKEKCATVLKPVTDRVNSVKDTYNGVVTKGKEKVDAVKDFGWAQVNRTLETPAGKFSMEKVNDYLTLSEDYIEKYLPPEAEEEKEEGMGEGVVQPAEDHDYIIAPPLEVDEVSTFIRVTYLSSKLRQRMYKRAMKDLKGLQVRSKEKLKSLNFTVDLIQYAKTGAGEMKESLGEKYEVAQQRVTDLWEQINDETPEDEPPTTMEEKAIVVARRLTFRMKKGITTLSGYLPAKLQPQVVKERLVNARQYSEELYQSFKQAQGFDDLPSSLLVQAKDKMSYLHETVSFLTDTFIVAPINWLFSANRLELEEMKPYDETKEIEMEPVDKISKDQDKPVDKKLKGTPVDEEIDEWTKFAKFPANRLDIDEMKPDDEEDEIEMEPDERISKDQDKPINKRQEEQGTPVDIEMDD